MRRLYVAVFVGIVLLLGLCVLVRLTVEIPVAVICDRDKPNVEISSTAIGGYFETHRIGPCVTYTHKRRPVPGILGGRGGGD